MNLKLIDMDNYYRKRVFEHFTKDCMCSSSMTHRIDVTDLVKWSKDSGTKFYINFLYCLAKALNSREDYRLTWNYQTQELFAFDKINPTQYIFHDDTETFTIAYTEYDEDYRVFYERALADAENAKKTREYGLDAAGHPNWFDASCMPWLSYDSFNVELPDGYLYFNPIVNWGKFQKEFDGRIRMPLSVRMNHAVADGYLVAKVFMLVEEMMAELIK